MAYADELCEVHAEVDHEWNRRVVRAVSNRADFDQRLLGHGPANIATVRLQKCLKSSKIALVSNNHGGDHEADFHREQNVMADFTPTQGRYLSFIQAYINLHGCPPSESDIARTMCVSAPSANQMVKMLERKGLILRQPGKARALQILIPEAEIPPWNKRKQSGNPAPSHSRPSSVAATPAAPPVNLYVFLVFLRGGPTNKEFANKEISRVIEIRGDQTLEDLHQAIFQAYERIEQQKYEFQLGKRPFDPLGPNYGNSLRKHGKKRDAHTTTLDDLAIEAKRAFGYRFDFRANWYHQVQVERIEKSIPTVTYPRVIKRVGKSPPQHADEKGKRVS